MSVGRHHKRAIIAVINLKGGTAKTTSSVFLSHALHEMGRTVLLVDADPQASAATWQEGAPEPFPFPLLRLPSKRLHLELQDHMRDQYNAVVIDTPPLEQQAGIVASVLRVATLAVIPVAPTAIEVERVYAVKELLEDSAANRPDGHPVPAAVLFTRVRPHVSSTEAYREQLAADGFWPLRMNVGLLERFGQAYAENVRGAMQTAYGDVIHELLSAEVVA